MAGNDNALQRLKELLKTLFQLDCTDLDFGIYRIMNYKRKEIENFIDKDLIHAVDKEFEAYRALNREELLKKIAEKEKEIHKVEDSLGQKILKNGRIEDEFKDRPVAQQYLELKSQLEDTTVTENVQAQVFNDLYNFLSRYYEDGDFISKRRYSAKGTRYAIPYNGEEVKLYWANFDQYYVKTAEIFKDYAFYAKDWRVTFRTILPDVETGNARGERRYFLPAPSDTVNVNKNSKTCLINFNYRPLIDDDFAIYKVTTKSGEEKKAGIKQDELNGILKDIILRQMNENELIIALAGEKDDKTVLEKHLWKYTRKITSDFFIHKNLKGFLERELDYFIKSEVLDLSNLDDRHITRAKVIENIAKRIIEFLAQIEDYQKLLWEKKKFVLKTDYVITIDQIPEEFHGEILKCPAQLQEWQDLGFGQISNKKELDGKKLPVDTKHFDGEFKEKLLEKLSEQGNFDDLIDGVLIRSENWQALNLLLETYKEKIKCIHIDPPYNTQTSGFLYKNDYQHSSWLSMMEDRIKAGIDLMTQDGSFLCHVDENEHERLHMLFDRFSVPDAGTIAWDKRNPMNAGRGVATQHEYIIWRSRQRSPIYLRNKNMITMLRIAAEIMQKHGGATKEAQKEYAAWVSSNSELTGGEKAYRYLDEQCRVYRGVSLRAPEPRTNPKFHIPLIHPVTKKPCAVPPNGFSRTPETLQEMIEKGEIIFGPDETTQPQQKRYLTEESKRQISSVIQDGRKGKADLSPLGLDFPYCHPVSLYEELIGAVTQSATDDDIVLDHFAGSGTSGHAVINLNREDGRRRKFILVEMADYFDTVLLPRIKKLTFAPEWKDGKPAGGAGMRHIVKYQCLEQYEDTLHNIAFPQHEQGQTALNLFGDEYAMKYMLNYETEGSPSLLSLKQVENPFEYKLKIISHGNGEQLVPVDLVETFNYLLGLTVNKYKFISDNGRKYVIVLGEKRNRRIAVVWRPTKDIDLQKDKEIIEKAIADFHPDEIFINGDAYLNYKLIEAEFKALMGV